LGRWPFARLYVLLVALAFAVVGLQALLFHGPACARAFGVNAAWERRAI
jgi:hypothetical protein